MDAPPRDSAPRRPAETLRRLGRLAGGRRGLLALQVAVAALLVAGLLRFVDWRSLVQEAAAVHPAAVAGAAAALVAILLVGAFDLWVLLGGLAPLSYPATLRIYAIGWSSFLALPGSAGDAVQILLFRQADVEYRQGTAVTVGGWWLFRTGIRSGLLALLGAGAAVLAAAVYALARRSGRPLARRAVGLLDAALGHARRHPGRIAANVAGTAVKALLTAVSAWALLRGLGVGVPLGAVLVVHHAAALVAYLPVAFNGIGTVELAAVGLYGALGVAPREVLALYLLLRGLILVLALLALVAASFPRRGWPRSSGASRSAGRASAPEAGEPGGRPGASRR
jgi:hypothetical protein